MLGTTSLRLQPFVPMVDVMAAATKRNRPARTRGPSVTSRILGCLLGGAVGDALGAPVEFMSLAEIRERFGPDGIKDLAPAYGLRGAITDDTQMTMFTAEGLLRAYVRGALRGICSVPSVVLHAYLRWLRTQGETSSHSLFDEQPDGWLIGQRALWSRRAPGNTCLAALRAAERDRLEAANDSKGCGAIMRVAPVGLVWPATDDAESEPFAHGLAVSRLTHGHPTGYLSGAYFAQLVALLAEGAPLRTAVEQARRPLESHDRAREVLGAIDSALRLVDDGHEPTAERVETLGAGWTGEEALAIALYCALVARDFEHGVRLAVSHSGDSDSTGSLVGNLLGVTWGVEAVPARWLEQLELREVIAELGRDLASIRAGTFDHEASWDKYPGW
jgi:ADP-ribosylglycohydrolase